ncbi:MAG: hypothetical protein SOY42_08355 [Clostridium sp.]|nr:hypothetical protein [Clostridium sp.]
MNVLIEGEKKKLNKSLIFLVVYLLEFSIQFIVAFLIPIIMDNRKIDMESANYFIKVLSASLIIGTVLGIIVSKIIEEQEERKFITVTETGVKGITNENFTTTFKEFSVDFSKIISVDLHKNAIIINTYDDSYICSGYDNVSKIKDIIMAKF